MKQSIQKTAYRQVIDGTTLVSHECHQGHRNPAVYPKGSMDGTATEDRVADLKAFLYYQAPHVAPSGHIIF